MEKCYKCHHSAPQSQFLYLSDVYLNISSSFFADCSPPLTITICYSHSMCGLCLSCSYIYRIHRIRGLGVSHHGCSMKAASTTKAGETPGWCLIINISWKDPAPLTASMCHVLPHNSRFLCPLRQQLSELLTSFQLSVHTAGSAVSVFRLINLRLILAHGSGLLVKLWGQGR